MKPIESIWRLAKRTRRLNIGPITFLFHFRKRQKLHNNVLFPLKVRLRKFLFEGSMKKTIDIAGQEIRSSNIEEGNASNQISVIVGVGPGLGESLVVRLAEAGHRVVAVSRDIARLNPLIASLKSHEMDVTAYSCDATDEMAVRKLFSYVGDRYGVPNLVVYSVQYFAPGRVIDVELPAFEDGWRNNCLGGFLVAREACRAMRAKQRGTIILVGSTSSLFAREDHLNLAVGKFGLRALSQVLAREVWPLGIHVAHLIIDAEIDEGVEGNVDRPKANPDNISNAVFFLHQQPPDTWTNEMDIRPSQEVFWEHC